MTTQDFLDNLTTQELYTLASLPKLAREGKPGTMPDGLGALTLRVVIQAIHYGVVETVEMVNDDLGTDVGVKLTLAGERGIRALLGE